MAQLGKNACTPARIFGPAHHTLFCGCSVRDFSVSAGWNEQSSSLTVTLIEDTCAGDKIWWDENLVRQRGNVVDPGFIEPEPGAAAYFRIEENPDGATEADRGGFEYCGLVESWTQKTDAQGNPVYTVKLTDPHIILENTQVIVNDYPGDTEFVWNLINAYGFVESLGTPCASSPAGAIGGVTANNTLGNITNDRGMVWNDLKCAIHTLCSSFDKALANSLYYDYCVDNRLVYVGPKSGQSGYGLIKKDDTITDADLVAIPYINLNQHYYYVDLTELPFAPPSYRISGPNISLMEIISQVCQDSGCDYYLELLPVINGNQIIKVIKVRVSVRSSQPQLDRLDDFIAAKQAQASHANGGIIAHTKGEEVRNEETSNYLMGGKNRDAFEANSTQIVPYWGLDTDGNLIQATIVDNEYRVRLDLGRLNGSLNTPFSSQYRWIFERELRAALSDMDSWREVCLSTGGEFATHLALIDQKSMLNFEKLDDALEGNIALAAVHINITEGLDEANNRDLDTIYNFVRSYAEEFYGRQFLVANPNVCDVTDGESGTIMYSHEPSPEGCWVADATSTVLGLTHNSVASDFFRDEVGKYNPVLRFPLTSATRLGGAGSLVSNPEKIGDENYISNGTTYVWVKADVNPQWVHGIPTNPSSNTISYLLTINAPVTNRVSDTNNFPEIFGGLDLILNGKELAGSIPKVKIIDRGVALGAIHAAILPDAALCPTLSNVDIYGPWGVTGLPGQVVLEEDEGFVPWEYGSDIVMNTAALNKVSTSFTRMRKGERGSVTVAGVPNIPLCAELFSVDTVSPPTSQGNQKYAFTRTFSTSVCASVLPFVYVSMNSWTGEFGPNVTQVNVTYGVGGFTTEYQFSTYTPQFGRFNKDNAERLRRIGTTRLAGARALRARSLTKANIAFASARRRWIDNKVGKSKRAPNSPNHLFLGRYVGPTGVTGNHSGRYRPEINTQSAGEAGYAFQSNASYAETAVMSLDGMFRPVSRSGDGGLTPYYVVQPSCTGTYSGHYVGIDPPVDETSGIVWAQKYLDPVSNSGDALAQLGTGNVPSGHDIEILGRGPTPPISGWAIQEGVEAGTGGYTGDYRFMAWKGPILIQQYGRDVYGKPVPNAADTEASCESGIFTTGNLTDRFLEGFLQKPKTWPVAPLDLALDRTRGVWTVPQTRPLLHARSSGSLSSGWHIDGTGTGVIFYTQNHNVVFDATGGIVDPTTIKVEWPWSGVAPHSITGKVPVYYDAVDCKYYGLPVGGTMNICGTDWHKAHKIASLRPVLYSGWPAITTGNPEDIISGCSIFSTDYPFTTSPNTTGVDGSDIFTSGEIAALTGGNTGYIDEFDSANKIDFKYGFRLRQPSGTNTVEVDATDWKVTFEIVSANVGADICNTGRPTAIANITSIPVGRELSHVPFQGPLTGQIEVVDTLGFYFNEPFDELVGRKGWAQLMGPSTIDLPLGITDPLDCHAESGTTGLGLVCQSRMPYWQVSILGCGPFTCNEYI